ncbi:F-box domain containing protein [Trema orientale]|uniref:F-box domain containing protein n=1 Tax=Trema orientale TaxID=63057 RepID=A0A2P5EUU7_TREOI|nr:F-box domain containing protein [Trema orientale]
MKKPTMKDKPTVKDRFSDLPDHLIHQIMSLRSLTEATRFSTLSKRMSSPWISFPVLEFESTALCQSPHKQLMILTFVRESLKRRRAARLLNFKRLSFRVFVDHYEVSRSVEEVLENLLEFAIHNKVIELELSLDHSLTDYQRMKSMPEAIFYSQTLREISLSGLKFSSNHHLILYCPSIEDFSIFGCIGFRSVVVAPSAKLIKRIQIDDAFT